MPIRIVVEKRHDRGEPDINYPAVFCDLCGERIIVAGQGNAYWCPDFDHGNEQFYQQKYEVYFAHKQCDGKMSALIREKKEPFEFTGPFGVIPSTVFDSSWWIPLSHYLSQLVAHLSSSDDTRHPDDAQ